jgi:hypothetical protein
MEILKSFDGLVPETVIPAKAGIQVLFLGPRFRGDDDQENLALANAKPAVATTVESVITFENCYNRQKARLPAGGASWPPSPDRQDGRLNHSSLLAMMEHQRFLA